MKVVFFSPTAHGGQPAYIREVMTAISKLKNGVLLNLITRKDLGTEFTFAPYQIERILPELKNRQKFNSTIAWAWSRLSLYLFQDARFLNFCRKSNVDVVHLQEITPIFSIATIFLLKFILDIKVVMTLHNVKPHKYPRFIPKNIIDLATSIRISLADRILVHTHELKKLAINISSQKYDYKILVAPHGVWSYYGEELVKVDTVRTGLFFFGVVRANKGIELLLQALLILHTKGLTIPTTIAGKIEDQSYYDNTLFPLIRRLSEFGYPLVFKEGFASYEDIRAIADTSQYLVLPYTDFSAQSGVLFDALALGIPLITTPGHSVAEFVSKYEIGAVSLTTAPEDLASVIENELCRSHQDKYVETLYALKQSHSWVEHATVAVNAYYE